jgi:lactoylglutathione lyase
MRSVHFPSLIAGLILGVIGATSAGLAFAGTRASPSAVRDTGAADPVPKVTGIGGIFFKAKDPKALTNWYVKHLGFPPPTYGVQFEWRTKDDPSRVGSTTWGTFPLTTRYFDPTVAPFMVNYRVTDLDGVRETLRRAGAQVDDKTENEENGRFGWAVDPEGNRFELWEPKPGM